MATGPMQGMHSMWYDHYKGAVYPLQLEGQPCCGQTRTTASSLLESCCAYIVRDANLTRAAIECVPPILCIHMMEAALRGNHDRSIQALMSRWRLKSLVLSKLAPPVFSSLSPLYEPLYQSAIIRQGLRYTTSLAHTFLECLRQESPTNIRHLDLTGFPTAEVILYYLTSHCMLVHNENRRNNMVSLYNQAVNLAEECVGDNNNQHSPMKIDTQNCLPNDISIEIKLDAFVTSESCHAELCKALTVSSFPGVRFRLVAEKLSVTCLGGERVNLLLKQISPEQLKGLQLKYNSLRNNDFVRLAPILQSLTNLTALDLSCNNISLYQNEQMAVIMRHAFSTLTHLERLDLSNNRLKDKLCTVLLGIVSPLKFLSLAACGLTMIDLTALALFPYLDSMEELDISETNLIPSHFPLIPIFGKVCNSIKVVQLQDCNLDDETMNIVLHNFDFLPKLLYINLAGNPWHTETSIAVAQKLAKLPALKVLRLTYPPECYGTEEDEIVDEAMESQAKDAFRASMNAVFELDEAEGQRTENVKLVIVEKDRQTE